MLDVVWPGEAVHLFVHSKREAVERRCFPNLSVAERVAELRLVRFTVSSDVLSAY